MTLRWTMRRQFPLAVALILLVVQPAVAHAYVGPAATMSFCGAAFGLIAAILSAIGVLLFWPVKLLLRSIRRLTAPVRASRVERGAVGQLE